MKKLIYLMIVVLMASCSMQKRKYTSGWHIQWNKIQQTGNNRETVEYHAIGVTPMDSSASEEASKTKTQEEIIQIPETAGNQTAGAPEKNGLPKVESMSKDKKTKRIETIQKLAKRYEQITEANEIRIGKNHVQKKMSQLSTSSDWDNVGLIMFLIVLIVIVLPVVLAAILLLKLFQLII